MSSDRHLSRPLRVALLMHSVLPRGGVVHTLELAQALARLGVQVSVLAPVEPGQTLFRPLPADVPLRFVPLVMPTPTANGLREQVAQRIHTLTRTLPSALAHGGFDLLHAQDSLNGQALAQLRPDVPWLRTVHHLDDFSDPQLADWQAGSWRRAQAVCCVSEAWWQRLRDDPAAPPVHRVFNGVDTQRFQPQSQDDARWLAPLGLLDTRIPLILAVGGVESRKNSARLLAAFARFRREVSSAAQARLLVVGGASLLEHSAEQHRWQTVLTESGLSEGPDQAVWRTGALPDGALPALMRRARLLAMPSLNEGFGLVALEALACGTPVLVSRRPPFTEHLAHSPGVSWCDPEDPHSLALGLARAWCQPRLSSPPPVCHTYSWERSACVHLSLYRQVLQAHRADVVPSSTFTFTEISHARHALHPALA